MTMKLPIRFEDDRGGERHADAADLVHRQLPRRHFREAGAINPHDVQARMHRVDGGRQAAGAEHHLIGPAAKQRRLVQPDQARADTVGDARQFLGRQHVAARHVDLAVEHQGHGAAGGGLRQVAGHGDDARHQRPGAGGHGVDPQPRLHRAGGDRAGEAAEPGSRPVDPLHMHAKRVGRGGRRRLRAVQRVQQGGAAVPGHGRAAAGDIVAVPRA
jgi:hypothetical protein